MALKQTYQHLRLLSTPYWMGKLAKLIAREGIELWFCPFIYALPLDTDVPIVTTIPDLQHEHYSDLFSGDELALRTLGYQYSCKVAIATIGISKHVADEIVKFYNIDSAKVFGIPLALDQSYQVSPEEIEHLVARVRLKFCLDQEFILYPANGWQHKNHEKLIEAIDIVHRCGYPVNLILTGAEFDVMDRLRPLLSQYGLHQVIRHLGYVDKQDLIGLYSAARMLIFPSLFEGFGLPLLEAMYLGVPVACSQVGSLPEVGDKAVLYFDPERPENIAEAILKVSRDEAFRQQLITAGKEQIKCFSYVNTAKQTMTVFEKIRDGVLVSPGLPPFRPLISHNWLNEGYSRWYFHAPSLSEIEFKVVQPTILPELANQTITVLLDERKMLESAIEPQHEYQFAISTPNNPDAGFHRLDIFASAKVSVSGQVLSAQVPSLVIINASGKRLNLIK
jgi:glycosyltransferase involved in cell wall biosynthesis